MEPNYMRPNYMETFVLSHLNLLALFLPCITEFFSPILIVLDELLKVHIFWIVERPQVNESTGLKLHNLKCESWQLFWQAQNLQSFCLLCILILWCLNWYMRRRIKCGRRKKYIAFLRFPKTFGAKNCDYWSCISLYVITIHSLFHFWCFDLRVKWMKREVR